MGFSSCVNLSSLVSLLISLSLCARTEKQTICCRQCPNLPACKPTHTHTQPPNFSCRCPCLSPPPSPLAINAHTQPFRTPMQSSNPSRTPLKIALALACAAPFHSPLVTTPHAWIIESLPRLPARLHYSRGQVALGHAEQKQNHMRNRTSGG
ncbi:uncharacterized protein B0I36DRAFT_331109 [Microdochium trichocladiopsis]|uniref:Secreted protein n=1 Tax=Microdochium trichocladiopsis TaxID=1682393 RepID=A0A9P9BMV5_9PEZI|nr:uncharacterized protein B0I36DRAFT_331109 [Microdochium trichocladiopsis]KAH7026665.1 hypothetical protein B0I36DRAFT_331109 [Microdochium trichocladiopsis]